MTKKKIFKIKYQATLLAKDDECNVLYWVSKPLDSNYQKINEFSINHLHLKKYKTKENEILYFKDFFSDKFDVLIEISGLFTKGNSEIGNIVSTENKRSPYIKSENYLRQTPAIKKLSRELTKNEKSDEDKARKIFEYVIGSFKYEYPVCNRGVENLNLKNLKGDCAEYSSLFVTMCRAVGIEARNVTGFVIFEKEKSVCEHGWAQINSADQGWVDVDPQYASLEKSLVMGTKKYFMNRYEYRLITTIGFNLKIEPPIQEKYIIDHENNTDSGLIRNRTQVLQPMVFATDKQIKFKSNISLK